MRKLLNTLYITNEKAFLCLDGENIVCKIEDENKFRIPFENVEGIVCFSYLGCSPALMGKCVEKCIHINFVSPNGKFLAKVLGETKGNVFLRIAQIDKFREYGVKLTQNTMASKFCNTTRLIKRTLHDNANLRDDKGINNALNVLKNGIDSVYRANTVEEIVGIEGNCAKAYFSIFNKLFTNKGVKFESRTKRPPLDCVNATLSFLYTILTNEYAAALETVGLDSYIGFCHKLRSGRVSLACDLIEETRSVVDRFVITLFNLKILNEDDFQQQISGAVLLNDKGRKKVITKWQEKKRSEIVHTYLNQKIMFGLLPYVQSNLLAKFVRGELDEYPCYIVK
mgnify:CR=1 FL=1